MSRPPLKPSRVQRMKDIDRLHHEAKEIYDELEQHLRIRNRLARRVRKLVKKSKRTCPDMWGADHHELSLHDHLDSISSSICVEPRLLDDSDDPVMAAGAGFRRLFRFLNVLSDVPWLKDG